MTARDPVAAAVADEMKRQACERWEDDCDYDAPDCQYHRDHYWDEDRDECGAVGPAVRAGWDAATLHAAVSIEQAADCIPGGQLVDRTARAAMRAAARIVREGK